MSIQSATKCSICGFDNSRPQIAEGLEYGTLLNDRYLIGKAKSMNGEGITYAAFDETHKKVVEVREFYPTSISDRADDNMIHPHDGHEIDFNDCLAEFISLSKNVSRMKEVSVITSIIDIFEENYTAYAVYEYEPSITLKKYIDTSGVMNWNQAQHAFQPLLTALGLMNSLGVSHLGISPYTIRVTAEGTLLMTGFSIEAARRVGTPIVEELYDGCAAIEQYSRNGVCSETTDVYAFAASFMYAITGMLPDEAPARLKDERLLIPKEYLTDMPSYAVTAMANALQVKPENRTTTFQLLKAQFSAPTQNVTESINTGAIRRLPSMNAKTPQNKGVPPIVWLIGTFALTLIALIIIVSLWFKNAGMDFDDIKGLFVDGKSSSSANTGVPNMLGESLDEWQEKVDSGEYDFKINVVSWEFTDTVAQGNIISQNPMSGDPMPEDKTIVVVVSRGSAMRSIPEIAGMSFVDMQAVLEENGFVVIKEERSSNDVALGHVIAYKDLEAGMQVEYGSQITLIVSTGPEE